MSKIKVEDLPSFDASDHIKTVEDVRDWLETSLQEDRTIQDFRHTLSFIIRSIDKNISKLN